MPLGLARLLSGPGFGFAGLLAILFIGLKMTAHIDWSWWWVLAPMWLPASTLALLVVILGAFHFSYPDGIMRLARRHRRSHL